MCRPSRSKPGKAAGSDPGGDQDALGLEHLPVAPADLDAVRAR